MSQDAYTGVQGIVSYAGAPIAIAECDVTITRGVAAHPRSGKWSDLKLPGKLDVAGTLKRIQVDGVWLTALLTGTPTTGAAEALHAGLTYPGAAGENVTDMTDTVIAAASIIRLTALTAAITAGGHAILRGTNVDGADIIDDVTVPTLGINATVDSKLAFKTLTHVALFDIVGAGGTLKVDSIVGDSTAGVAEPKTWNFIGEVVDGTNHIYINMNNCFFTSGKFHFSNANAQLSDEMAFTMKDPDADLSIEYINT
jgi:hypothetical protein